MKPPPFDAARQGSSNELCYILQQSLNAEITCETQFFNNTEIRFRYFGFGFGILDIGIGNL